MRNRMFVMLALIAISSSANASNGYVKLDCESKEDTSRCSNSCRNNAIWKRRIEFIVNTSTGVVMQNTYDDGEGGKLVQSVTLKNCSVADSKNWVCGEKPSDEEVLTNKINGWPWSFAEIKSVNGNISETFESHSSKNDLTKEEEIRGYDKGYYSCFKKISRKPNK